MPGRAGGSRSDRLLHAVRLRQGLAHAAPLVLLHGFTGDATTWGELVAGLADDRDVWAVDLLGHGRSPAPSAPEAYASTVQVDLLDAALSRTGHDRAHWLGYSMGGRLALCLAVARPARVGSLVLVGASPGIADPSARSERRCADEALAASIEADGLEAFVDRWMALPLFATQDRLGPQYLARARAQRLGNRPEALAASLRGFGTGAMPSLWHRLPALAMPVLAVAGALDPKFADLAGRTAARIPGGRALLVPEAGHAVPAEAPGALAAAVTAFLREVEGVSASPAKGPS